MSLETFALDPEPGTPAPVAGAVPSGPAPGRGDAPAPPAWPSSWGDDDVLPLAAERLGRGEAVALATVVAAEGGPRPVGSQLLVASEGWRGFLSGGCVEADVARHGRAALEDGRARRLTYGRGSPFFDIRLPCGGRIEILVEALPPAEPSLLAVAAEVRARRAARWLSDGARRGWAAPGDPAGGAWPGEGGVDRLHLPAQRLIVMGHDPFALAIAAEGLGQGWEVTLLRPGGPAAPPPLPVAYRRDPPAQALAGLDPWTAVAIATHDPEADHEGLLAALRSGAGYVGCLGSRRRAEERRARLAAAGLAKALARLRAPIGLAIGGRSPREIALAVVGEVVAARAVPR